MALSQVDARWLESRSRITYRSRCYVHHQRWTVLYCTGLYSIVRTLSTCALCPVLLQYHQEDLRVSRYVGRYVRCRQYLRPVLYLMYRGWPGMRSVRRRLPVCDTVGAGAMPIPT